MAFDKYNKVDRFEDCKTKLNKWVENVNLQNDEDEIKFLVEEFEYVDGHDGVDLLIEIPIGVGPISLYHEALVDEPEKTGPEILKYVREKFSEQADLFLRISESIQI